MTKLTSPPNYSSVHARQIKVSINSASLFAQILILLVAENTKILILLSNISQPNYKLAIYIILKDRCYGS